MMKNLNKNIESSVLLIISTVKNIYLDLADFEFMYHCDNT